MAVFDGAFPCQDLLPKRETGAISFLTKYPHYDGRGTVIAIFDSAVDPKAPGLQVTSEGKPKIIDRYDGSGNGDVAMVAAESKNGFITGMTGRQLKVPDTWVNPTGQYFIGAKSLYELYPTSLKERMAKEYKENTWDPKHKAALAEATKMLHSFETANLNPVGVEKLAKEDLEMQIEMLNSLEKKYNNAGPCLDCIVFHDGQKWRACLDTTFEGDLSSCQVLGIYRETLDIGTLSQSDQLSYSVNIYDEGSLLEIVTMCSSHGTHVASIAAACFPDDPDKNGLAPGAQIVSITIGDNRLGSMETGTALMRAMIRVVSQVDYKVDVINMSYGEHAHWIHSGRLGEMISEVVNKYGIIWVVSASNNGPALSTIGSPPAVNTSTMIGVGAYVSPEMMLAEYSMREKLPGMAYTWSSRGPCLDGSLGVSICAPGGAITSVPNFLLRCSQLMNGTSMAAPHAAGAVALLLSGLKCRDIAYSPFSVKRAMEETAHFMEHVQVFAQGHGLLQVDRAFEHLVAHHTAQERDVRFQVTVANGLINKGIYLRDADTSRSKEFNVTVEPLFLDNDSCQLASRKIDFNLHLALTCSAAWVHAPRHLDLMFMARGFSVKVDPTGLACGVHYASVRAYDVTCVEKGAVFELPITVVKPEPLHQLVDCRQHFKSGDIQRRFVTVPDGATWAELRLQLDNKETESNNARFIVHAVQLVPQLNCKTFEFDKLVDLHELAGAPLTFSVRAARVLEVCITKWWASLGSVGVTYSLTFHGVTFNSPARELTMHSGRGVFRLELGSKLANQEIAPVVTLKHQVLPVRPSEWKVVAMGCRDLMPQGRQIYELQLSYNFNVAKATEVVPNCAFLSDVLYESEFESQLWMIFDSNKQFMAAGDAFPSKYVAKLDKGDYTLRLHVRHDKKDLLEKFQDMPVLIAQKLSSAITMDVYSTQNQALVQGKKLTSTTVHKGETIAVYIAPLNSDKCPKVVAAGQYLSGTISLPKDEHGKKVDVHPFSYVMVESAKKNNGSKGEPDKSRTKEEEMIDAVRDLKINWITKLDNCTSSTELFEELRAHFPDHLPVYIAQLQALEADKDTRPKSLIDMADLVINNVNTSELLEYYGLKSDTRPDANKIKSRMDKQKGYLLEALAKKGLAMCQSYNENSDNVVEAAVGMEEILNNYHEIVKFAEPSDSKVARFCVQAALLQKHYGRALRLVSKQFEEKPSRELEEKMSEVFAHLKWQHCIDMLKRSLPMRYPASYRPF